MKKMISNFWIKFDYDFLLELFAFLPYKLGRKLSCIRGRVYYFLKRDWRIFTFKDFSIHNNFIEAYKEMFPEKSEKEISDLVKKRYEYQSVDEYEAKLLAHKKFKKQKVKYLGLEKVKSYLENNNKCVFITAHFGSSISSVSHLEIFGTPILGMSSNVTKNSLVHQSISNLYKAKYENIASFLNGGDVLDIETNAKRFLKFIKDEGSLIIIADIPSYEQAKDPLWKNFIGKNRAFAPGAYRYASNNNTIVIPFVSYYENNEYIMKFGDLDVDPYEFLEKEIMKQPQLWWACDLLKLYPKK